MDKYEREMTKLEHCMTSVPFKCRHTHDVQARDPLRTVLRVHLLSITPTRALHLSPMPLLVVIPNLFDGQALWTVLFVRKEQERHAKDLGRRQNGVLCPLPPMNVCVMCGDGGVHTEDFPTFTQAFAVLRVDHEHDCVTVVVVAVPDRPYSTLAPQIPELQDC